MTAELSVSQQSSFSPTSGSPHGGGGAWAKVVRGETESDSTTTGEAAALTDSAPSSGQTLTAADETPAEVGSSDGGNVGGGSKKAVWKIPVDTAPVMDAELWPDLSEAARLPNSSSSSSEASKPPPPQEPAHTPNHTKPNNHGHFNREKMKRTSSGTGIGGGSAGFRAPPPPPTPLPPPFPIFDMPYTNLVPPVLDAPVRGEGPHQRPNSNWTPRPIGDRAPHRDFSRRGPFVGGRPRGDGPYANGYGGRPDHDPRGSNGRDAHRPHQMGPPPPLAPRGFIRPPFITPQPLRPLMNPMGYDMPLPYPYGPPFPPPEAFRGAPSLPHAAPIFFPPPLRNMILNQIEYYFSETNLEKDVYLRSNMDDEAWVPVSLIANFRRVLRLTNDIQLILDTLRNSTVVEVQGNKLRPKDWKKWATNSGKSSSLSLQNLVVDDSMSSRQVPSSSSGQVPSSSSGQVPSSSTGQVPSSSSGQVPSSSSGQVASSSTGQEVASSSTGQEVASSSSGEESLINGEP